MNTRRTLIARAPLLLMLSSCAVGTRIEHAGPNAPRHTAGLTARLTPSSLALVLSSGGPRGFVHLGVLKALEEIDVQPDIIVGASVGALIASLYCSGLRTDELIELALDLKPWSLVALRLGTGARFSGLPIARLVSSHLQGRPLQALRPHCAIVALRLSDRRVVAFTDGDASVAVQASTAIEGQFNPVRIHGQDFADPDLVSPMPVRLVRQLGAKYVMSVDASAHEERAPPEAERFRQGDQFKRMITRPDARAADLNLHPDFGYWVSISRAFRERAIQAGYEETLRARDAIRALSERRHTASKTTG